MPVEAPGCPRTSPGLLGGGRARGAEMAGLKREGGGLVWLESFLEGGGIWGRVGGCSLRRANMGGIMVFGEGFSDEVEQVPL